MVLWLNASSVVQVGLDCADIAHELGLELKNRAVYPWQRLLEIQRHLATTTSHAWLVILDNLFDVGKDQSFHRFCESPVNDRASILLTTIELDIAQVFVGCRGLHIAVPSLDACYAANILSYGQPEPSLGVYDQLANMLEYKPRALVIASRFMMNTGMTAQTYDAHVACLTDDQYWRSDALAVQASKRAFGMDTGSHSSATPRCVAGLAAVLRSCIDPAWHLVFERLVTEDPVADEMLSAVSVMRGSTMPELLFMSNATTRAAAKTLVSLSVLHAHTDPSVGTAYLMSKLAMIARRVWLLKQNKLASAYATALQIVALQYPDRDFDQHRLAVVQMEPSAQGLLQSTAGSWLPDSVNSAWHRVILLDKRSKYLIATGDLAEAHAVGLGATAEMEAIRQVLRS